MRGCALRKVVRNLAHKKLENRGVEPQHLPSQIPRPAPTGWSPVGWWMAEKPGAEGSPRDHSPNPSMSRRGIFSKTHLSLSSIVQDIRCSGYRNPTLATSSPSSQSLSVATRQ